MDWDGLSRFVASVEGVGTMVFVCVVIFLARSKFVIEWKRRPAPPSEPPSNRP